MILRSFDADSQWLRPLNYDKKYSRNDFSIGRGERYIGYIYIYVCIHIYIYISGRSLKTGLWEVIPRRPKKILGSQNIVYDSQMAYQTTLQQFLVIFDRFEIFWTFSYKSRHCDFFLRAQKCFKKWAQKWGISK